jgi:hypothetical protein
MPNINPNRFPIDLTGTLQSNKIRNEAVVFTSSVRFYLPRSAPFFLDSMNIRDLGSGMVLNNTQWAPIFINTASTSLCPPGKSTYLGFVIKDPQVSNDLSIDYQTVGSDYVSGFENIINMLNTIYRDNRPVSWPDIEDLSNRFATNKHLHSIENAGSWEAVVHQIEQLKLAILIGDRFKVEEILEYVDRAILSSDAAAGALLAPGSDFHTHINTPNAHNVDKTTVGLSLVQNYAPATQVIALAGTSQEHYVTVNIAKVMIDNAVNGGVHAHILDTNNPHNLDKSDIGLPLLQNYAPATASEIANPVAGQPKYVTNTALKPYLDQQITLMRAEIDTTVDAFEVTLQNQLVASNASLNSVSAAIEQINTALSDNARAALEASSGKAVATQNEQDIAAVSSEVNTLLDTYLASAINRARNESYEAGYAAGQANA